MVRPIPAAGWLMVCVVASAAPARAEAAECPKCRSALQPGWKHCPECGKKLAAEPWWDLSTVKWDADTAWLLVGLIGQGAFAGRFFVQWLASERKGRSVVPPAFWYMSLIAGLMILAYGIYRWEPVIILSQVFNPVIYLRNIMLLARHGSRDSSEPAVERKLTPAAAPGVPLAGTQEPIPHARQ